MDVNLNFDQLETYKLKEVQVTDRELGHGSYATVLELDYIGLKCAGKKIHDELLKQDLTTYGMLRFKEECRLLSQVRHPNIVQFLGVYFQQGVQAPILVMEFLPTNLTSCIERYGILPKEMNYSILHDVALGLCYLHSQTPPIIHRDLSSNNVLLTPNMTAKTIRSGCGQDPQSDPSTGQSHDTDSWYTSFHATRGNDTKSIVRHICRYFFLWYHANPHAQWYVARATGWTK